MVAIPRGTNDGQDILTEPKTSGSFSGERGSSVSVSTNLCDPVFARDSFHFSPSFGIAAVKAKDSFFPSEWGGGIIPRIPM